MDCYQLPQWHTISILTSSKPSDNQPICRNKKICVNLRCLLKTMRSPLKILICSFALILSVLSTVLQYHSHDCLGHVSIDMLSCQLSLGCADNGPCQIETTHKNCDHPHSCYDSHRHQHDKDNCALHLDNIKPGTRNALNAPAVCLMLLPSRLGNDSSGDESGRCCRNHVWCRATILSEQDLICLVTPLRGSPSAEIA